MAPWTEISLKYQSFESRVIQNGSLAYLSQPYVCLLFHWSIESNFIKNIPSQVVNTSISLATWWNRRRGRQCRPQRRHHRTSPTPKVPGTESGPSSDSNRPAATPPWTPGWEMSKGTKSWSKPDSGVIGPLQWLSPWFWPHHDSFGAYSTQGYSR